MRFELFDVNARVGSVPNHNPRQSVTADDLLRQMDLFGVEEAVVWHAWGNRWDIALGNAELLCEGLGPERVLYGSDLPASDVGQRLGVVLAARVPAAANELILGRNMQRLLDKAG